ncbi:MAG: hypothetical protein H6825_07190 [Planctomycetes bacterium]|nr:hypothetical protein [Planctomycetota bacterium]
MSAPATIVGLGVVDASGVRGSSGVCAAWDALGVDPLGSGRTYRALFGVAHPTFRRLDGGTRALLLATAATGLERVLSPEQRDRTALVVETERGSLETDLRFAATLDGDLVEGALFPFTLANTSLGEVALQHELRGPSLCLSIDAAERGASLAEALALLRDGEADFVLAGRVESLPEPRGDLDAALACVVVLLARPDVRMPAVVAWPGDACDVLDAPDVLDALAARLFAGR